MIKENQKEKTNCCSDYVLKRGKDNHHNYCSHNHSDAIYGLGIIGALFYFLSSATTFSLVMIGIGKSIFWPAFVLFKVLTLLEM